MEKKKTLLYHADILTGEKDRLFIPGGYILVEGSEIAEVGTCPDGELPEADTRTNLHGSIVMPGMISTHSHFYGQFARGMRLGAPVTNWEQVLSRMWWRMDKALDEEEIRWSAAMGLAEGLKAGTTTYFDHQASPNCISGSLDILEDVMKQFGGRGCLAYEVTDRDGGERARAGIAENVRYIKKHLGDQDALFRGMMGLHASYTLGRETLLQCAEAGNALNAGFHIHVAEAAEDVADCYRRFGCHPVQRLFQDGILGEKTIAAHAVHVGRSEMEIMKLSKLTAAHNVQSNTNNAVGISPVVAMLENGVHVALGGDGYSYDLFGELGFAVIQQHLLAKDCSVFSSSQVIDTVFTNSSRLAGLVFGHDIGLIREGAAADLLILDYDPPVPLDGENVLIHMPCFSGHVSSVYVNGEMVIRDHHFLHIDEAEVRAKCREQARKLWNKLRD